MKAWITVSQATLDMLMRRAALATTAVALLLMGYIAAGRAEEKLPARADIEAGKAIADAVCANCHGRDGLSGTAGVPHLAGQYESYVAAALAAYKEGRRSEKAMVEADAGADRLDGVFSECNGHGCSALVSRCGQLYFKMTINSILFN